MTQTTEAGQGRSGRWSSMLDQLAIHGRLGVAEAASLLEVSEATVRRDFTELTRRQLATRTHGGIVATAVAYELPYRYRTGLAAEDLERIACATAALVGVGDVVAINGGTTTTQTARAIASREELAGTGRPITLVTNALNIASEAVLRPHIQCVSLGGVARPESYEMSGPLTSLVISQLWFDLAIVGVNGLTAAAGASCRFEDEAATVRAMIERAERVVVVAATGKLGKRSFGSICETNQISTLVTSAPGNHPEVVELRRKGVQVITV